MGISIGASRFDGAGGGKARKSLTDKNFDSMLPGFADHYLWDQFNVEPDLIAGAALPTAAQFQKARESLISELAKDKVRKALGGRTTVTAGIPKKAPGIPQVVVKKNVQRAIAKTISKGRIATQSQGSSNGGGSRTGGNYNSGYQGGTYGGFGGASINQGVGQAFKNR